MTVYNSARHLGPAIESILNQSFADFELIIVHDESTDHSREIIESYQDPRIRIIWNRDRLGLSHARNLGLAAASGEYLAVMDSDDLAFRDRLCIQNGFLDENPTYCLAGSAYELIDDQGRITGIQKLPTDDLTVRWQLLFGNVFGHSSVIYRLKEAREVGGYDLNLVTGEDYDLYLRLAVQGKICNMEIPVVQYRIHARNSTNCIDTLRLHQNLTEVASRAIRSLTGKIVSPEASRTLYRHLDEPAPDKATLRFACNVIEVCVDSLITSQQLQCSQRYRLIALAEDELHRIARKNCGAKAPVAAELRLLIKHDPKLIINKNGLKALLLLLLPGPVRRSARPIWRSIRERVFLRSRLREAIRLRRARRRLLIWHQEQKAKGCNVSQNVNFTGRPAGYTFIKTNVGLYVEPEVTIWISDDEGSQPELTLGKRVSLNRHIYVGVYLPISIGDNTIIGAYSYIISANHRYESRDVPIRDQGYVGAPINIGEDVWIGTHVVILPGVTIGKGAIIAAGSLVNRSVPEYEVWGGVPAHFIKHRPA